jgi:hypothetical protein
MSEREIFLTSGTSGPERKARSSAWRARLCLWGGFSVYAVSFSLTAVQGYGVTSSESPSVAAWSLDAFMTPLIFIHWQSVANLLQEMSVAKISFFLNGWVNPFFVLTMVCIVVGKTPKLTRIARYLVVLMVLFCWVTFAYLPVHPREGYIAWTLGMLMVLLSSELGTESIVQGRGRLGGGLPGTRRLLL